MSPCFSGSRSGPCIANRRVCRHLPRTRDAKRHIKHRFPGDRPRRVSDIGRVQFVRTDHATPQQRLPGRQRFIGRSPKRHTGAEAGHDKRQRRDEPPRLPNFIPADLHPLCDRNRAQRLVLSGCCHPCRFAHRRHSYYSNQPCRTNCQAT